jgi:hypothetical protein
LPVRPFHPLRWFLPLAAAACAPLTVRYADRDGDGVPNALDCAPDDASISPNVEDPAGDGVDANCDGVDGVADTEVEGPDTLSVDTEQVDSDTLGAESDGVDSDTLGAESDGVDSEPPPAHTGAPTPDTEPSESGPTPSDTDTAGTDTLVDSEPPDETGQPIDSVVLDTEPPLDSDSGLDPTDDDDSDGFPVATDCDDNNPQIYPNAPETEGDGVDSDCDGRDGANVVHTLTVRIQPEPAYTDDDLRLDVQVDNPDGDPLTWEYLWYVDGRVVASASGDTLSHTAFTAGQEVGIIVLASDGLEEVLGLDVIDILNAPPTLSLCALDRSTVAVDEPLAVLLGATDDLDGDPVVVTVQWQQRFGPVWASIPGQTGATLASCRDRNAPGYTYNCGVGTNLRVACRPSDGVEFGEQLTSAAVTVASTPPATTTCTIQPAAPTAADALQAVSAAYDPDPQDVTAWTYTWTLNGAAMPSTAATLPTGAHARGDQVRVSCLPSDTHGAVGVAMQSAPVLIANAPPVATACAIHPALPAATDTLTAQPQGEDADNDPLSWSYAWYVGGVLVGSTADTLAPPVFTTGDEVQVDCLPDDGVESGAARRSELVVIP